MGFRLEVEIPDQAGQYGDYRFPTSGLEYRIALTTHKISTVIAKDSNASKGSRDRDEFGSLTNTGYKHWSTIDSLTVRNPAFGVTELEEGKGSPA